MPDLLTNVMSKQTPPHTKSPLSQKYSLPASSECGEEGCGQGSLLPSPAALSLRQASGTTRRLVKPQSAGPHARNSRSVFVGAGVYSSRQFPGLFGALGLEVKVLKARAQRDLKHSW